MSNWQTYKLEEASIEIIDGDRGKNYPKQHEFYSYEYCLFLNTGNVTPSGFDFGNCQFINREKDQLLRKGKIQRNDIVLTTRGTVGNAGIYDSNVSHENIRINSGMVILRCNTEQISPNYLYQYIKSPLFKIAVSNFSTGSAQPQLPIRDLKKIEIPLPKLPTQLRIAEILSALDDKIELNRRMNQTLEQMAQTLFRQYFVDGIDEENLPEGWIKKSLGELVDITSSKRIFLNEYVPEGIPFYRGKEIIQLNRTGIISTELFITEEKFETIKAKFGVPKEGDILLTSVGTIGVPYLVNKDDVFYFKDGNITWVKSYLDHVGPVYLYQWLISEEGQSSIDNITIGSTQKAVTIQSLKSMQVIVPPKELHDSVCNQLQALRDKINHNIKEIRTLIQTRDSLLPKLMSGEIDVMQTKPEELHEPVLS